VAICYDRHFPEYMRALAVGGADLVIVPQAGGVDEWPEGLYEGEMRVAAFQNGYHVALCNRVGREECLEFAGESFVCASDGRMIARAARGADDILIADLALASAERSHARSIDARSSMPSGWRDDAGGGVSSVARLRCRALLCRSGWTQLN
jgi:N-carbamoylputrescine amidase